MMNPFEQDLLSTLLAQKKISQKQATTIVTRTKGTRVSVESLLVREAGISEEDILADKESISGGKAVDLSDTTAIPIEALREIPEDAVKQYKIIPLAKRGRELTVGMVNPEDVQAREALRFLMLRRGLTSIIAPISEKDFTSAVSKYRDIREEVGRALSDLEGALEERGRKTPSAEIPSGEQAEVIKEAPIIKVVAVILKHATEGGASDIHIEPTRNETHVRFRVDGQLHTSLILPSSVHGAVVARIKILAGMRLDESRMPQDGRFRTRMGNTGIDFRVSTFPTTLGEKVVMRVLDASSLIQSLDGLGLTGVNQERVKEAMAQPFGLIFLSGPTGSGKSTTLFVLLNLLPKETVNIVTIEDPVEYFISGVSQSEIRPDIGYTFASGLRHILRQDPDVIMVGEVRDAETAELVTHASLTGHVVFSTIHTNDAVGVIPRLIDMGVDNFLVPSALAAAIAQRLVRRMCDECKVKERPSPQIAKIIAREINAIPASSRKKLGITDTSYIWKPQGCKACGRKGYRGRIAIFEVLMMTPELKRLIYDGASDEDIRKEGVRQGMITMLQDGIIKALLGQVSIEEIIRATKET